MAGADNVNPISLNVGGTVYTTTVKTLTFHKGKLKEMFSGDDKPKFIDRDGAMFRYILNYLRDGKLALPSNFADHEQLLLEVRYYELGEDVEKILTREQDFVVVMSGKTSTAGHKICLVETSSDRETVVTNIQYISRHTKLKGGPMKHVYIYGENEFQAIVAKLICTGYTMVYSIGHPTPTYIFAK